MNTLEKLHNEDLVMLRGRVGDFYRKKKKFRIYHGSTNSTRTQKFKKDGIVDISTFNRVLLIDKEKKFALVEPNVPMDRLVEETLKFGLVPPVVMEFPGITVGGGIQGGAGESSSFKWGGFHHTCEEYEIVLGNGEVVIVNKNKNADLYWGTACSYGTLGIITKIKLRLIPAKKYVRLEYNRVKSFEESIKVLENLVSTNVDFIDGIMFSKDIGVIMTGRFSEKYDLPVTTFNKATDEWFYLHAEKVAKKHNKYEELIPLQDYLFRYNRGGFWVGKYAFTRGKIPFNRLTRFIFNPLFKTRTLYRFLQAINISQKQIVQDFILPKETVLKFLDYVDRTTKIYPLWLLPGELASKDDKLSPGYIKTEMGIDVGVWGKPKIESRSKNQEVRIKNQKLRNDGLYQINRELEKKLKDLGGRKVLYAHAYYPEKEFWQIYDKSWYTKLRKKYSAETVFPDIYEKTYVKEKYDVSFWKGLWNVVKSLNL